MERITPEAQDAILVQDFGSFHRTPELIVYERGTMTGSEKRVGIASKKCSDRRDAVERIILTPASALQLIGALQRTLDSMSHPAQNPT